MDHTQKLTIFKAQVENARSVEAGIRQVRRAINFALRRKDVTATTAFTRIYAMLFCAWAEVNFSKIVHTPYGFDISEIEQISAAKMLNIQQGWRKAVDLALRKLPAQRGSFQPNARQLLWRIIDDYVFEPSVIRNKLAHGQWKLALNREHTTIQSETTTIVSSLNIVQIDSWRVCHIQLAHLVETLVESPKKAAMRDWYAIVSQIEVASIEAKQRTMSEHLNVLQRKPIVIDR